MQLTREGPLEELGPRRARGMRSWFPGMMVIRPDQAERAARACVNSVAKASAVRSPLTSR